jgi:peptidoglycan/xylan/chitin deacetylase (PgdA/CDA1 family)
MRGDRATHSVAEPVVALTFDDGPSENTLAILDLLTSHQGTATFFVIGAHAAERPSRLLHAILDQGSAIGNHTFDHPHLTQLDDAELPGQITRTTAVIERLTGVRPRFWRPPYLESDERVRVALGSCGLEEALCSIAPRDFEWPAPDTAEYVLERVRAGSIVDLHDDDDCAETVHAVGTILEGLTARGLRCVTLTELLSLPAAA